VRDTTRDSSSQGRLPESTLRELAGQRRQAAEQANAVSGDFSARPGAGEQHHLSFGQAPQADG
jgi:hypothetical protein